MQKIEAGNYIARLKGARYRLLKLPRHGWTVWRLNTRQSADGTRTVTGEMPLIGLTRRTRAAALHAANEHAKENAPSAERMGNGKLLPRSGDTLPNGARAIMASTHHAGGGVVLASWRGELVCWRIGQHWDCYWGRYFDGDNFTDAVDCYNERANA